MPSIYSKFERMNNKISLQLKKQKMESAMNISISEGVPQTTQLDLEAKLRQTLLKEQEIRLRKRVVESFFFHRLLFFFSKLPRYDAIA